MDFWKRKNHSKPGASLAPCIFLLEAVNDILSLLCRWSFFSRIKSQLSVSILCINAFRFLWEVVGSEGPPVGIPRRAAAHVFHVDFGCPAVLATAWKEREKKSDPVSELSGIFSSGNSSRDGRHEFRQPLTSDAFRRDIVAIPTRSGTPSSGKTAFVLLLKAPNGFGSSAVASTGRKLDG